MNVGEEDLPRRLAIEEELRAAHGASGRDLAVMGGRFEMELNELSDEEATEFREEAGVEHSGMDEAVRRSYALLGLISFLTVGPTSAVAWTVAAGARPRLPARFTRLQRGFTAPSGILQDLVGAAAGRPKRRGLQAPREGYP